MKAFNYKYLEKYEKLEEADKAIISISDYLNAIENREAWKGVKLLGRKVTLEAAMKTTELREKVNQQLKKKRSAYLRRNDFSYSSYYDDSNFSNNNNNNNNNRNRNREVANKEASRQYYKTLTCYLCNQPGHKKFECPILESSEFLEWIVTRKSQGMNRKEENEDRNSRLNY
ncbi:hypothetical protein BCR32DRAFT_250936 [Anaeromyces robustus]|uniref:CCHC-type domain-containing protein n=1 Tax=Anaeromyces robustus TaxID=1754192 RepID=A0A1Y1VUW4_9FUNG|nr:hypothetical protein BCR32DRAFT_250936 [Anaeromyces robustus]|eukprot:ORX64805.1 hypothetical protein BCR32DRAFT_250936 [Anaeromyces robustus]